MSSLLRQVWEWDEHAVFSTPWPRPTPGLRKLDARCSASCAAEENIVETAVEHIPLQRAFIETSCGLAQEDKAASADIIIKSVLLYHMTTNYSNAFVINVALMQR